MVDVEGPRGVVGWEPILPIATPIMSRTKLWTMAPITLRPRRVLRRSGPGGWLAIGLSLQAQPAEPK